MDRDRIGMKWVDDVNINGSMKSFLCGDGADLYFGCDGGFTNLYVS